MHRSISAKKTATVHEAGDFKTRCPFFSPTPHGAHVSAGCLRWEATAGLARGPGGASVSQCDVWIMSTMAYFVFELGCEMGANDNWRKPVFTRKH